MLAPVVDKNQKLDQTCDVHITVYQNKKVCIEMYINSAKVSFPFTFLLLVVILVVQKL